MGAKRIHLRDVPTRLATGAYILHSGLEKWQGDEERAQALHGFAAGAYPLLAKVPPRTFLKALAVAEIGLGAALLTQLVKANPQHSAISISAPANNPAVRLYERFGFKIVQQSPDAVRMRREI